ncbi:MAG TPA: hypothetical protein VGG44_09725 [Tepidisphaeraceae bacterium]|jgi:hypothetical protein
MDPVLYYSGGQLAPAVSAETSLANSNQTVYFFEFLVERVQGMIDMTLNFNGIHDVGFPAKAAPISMVHIMASEVHTVNYAQNPDNVFTGFIGGASIYVTNMSVSNSNATFRLHVDWGANPLNVLLRFHIITLNYAGIVSRTPFPRL